MLLYVKCTQITSLENKLTRSTLSVSFLRVLFSDTSIAELLKEHTDSDDFRESLRVEQGSFVSVFFKWF